MEKQFTTSARSVKRSWVREPTDVAAILEQVDQLLREELTIHAEKLNHNLIESLQSEFYDWLLGTRKRLLLQLEKIPRHARERWLEERLSAGGLPREWFDRDGAGAESEAAGKPIGPSRQSVNQGCRLLTEFLLYFSEVLVTRLKRLQRGNHVFRRSVAAAISKDEREQVVLRYAEQLGAGGRSLLGDQQALLRWFDEEAVNDRYVRQLGESELLLTFVMNRLSVVLRRVYRLTQIYRSDQSQAAELWKRLSVEERVEMVWHYPGDRRVAKAALTCMRELVDEMPSDEIANLISPRFLSEFQRIAIRGDEDVWIQSDAIEIVTHARPHEAEDLLRRRLMQRREGDDIFVRRSVLKMAEKRLLNKRIHSFELPDPQDDPSEFVRQQYARVAYLLDPTSGQNHWESLATGDPNPKVRGAALLAATELPCAAKDRFERLETIVKVIQEDVDPFAIRVAMHVAWQILCQLHSRSVAPDESSPRPSVWRLNENEREAIVAYFRQRVIPAIKSREETCQEIPVRRWAAQTRERILVVLDESACRLLDRHEIALRSIPMGATRRFPRRDFQHLSDVDLGRILATLAVDDFGFDVHRMPWGTYITRGPVFGFRMWRFWFEASHPATDKRQGIRHTVGRINASGLRVMSQICGELSQTKVPGEPLTISSDGTWRPFLPLLDDFVAVLNQSWLIRKTVRFVSVQGVTSVRAPRSIVRRGVAAVQLIVRFAEIARMRNGNSESAPPNEYIETLRGIGFEIQFQPFDDSDHRSGSRDSSVARFFEPASRAPDADSAGEKTQAVGPGNNASIALLGGASLWDGVKSEFHRFHDYFDSSYQNSLEHLLLFALLVTVAVIAKHAYSNFRLFRARKRIPLSIGGWGTRGKSGTERLKAALIGALGHGLVSKTTGCEAMFIHAAPFSDPLEVPLFRPFEKATIWEQSNLLHMASGMKPSVFLWECMALTPSYVEVLQRQWTCDDLATITNTYPDHEDLQGPAGHNVASTISKFVPFRSRLLSSEEQMRPYLTDRCRDEQTSFKGVGWLESGLITDDVLERLPYREHPDNVALVTALAEELGCDHDVALKAMGDYLVPDLGVLKTHPVASVRSRKIEFTNGMSANERFGCMGNWQRLGYDRQDPWQEPSVWVTALVNNRADRVPRSKVFAKILVDDVSTDRILLIGNNLQGMQGFIADAWREHAATLSLGDPQMHSRFSRESALQSLHDAAWRFRIPHQDVQVRSRVKAMLRAIAPDLSLVDSTVELWEHPDQLREWMLSAGFEEESVESFYRRHREFLVAYQEYCQFENRIQSAKADDADQLNADFVGLLRRWFYRKLVVIDKYESTGEEVISRLVDETPPGFTNRVIGLQNIKGTGMDFVYRFQAWDVCHLACDMAVSPDAAVSRQGLEALNAMPEIGQLCWQAVEDVVRKMKANAIVRRGDVQQLLTSLESRVNGTTSSLPIEQDSDLDSPEPQATSNGNWNDWMVRYGQEYGNLRDSIARRDQADAVYQDLADQRIGRQRAVLILRELSNRQKS